MATATKKTTVKSAGAIKRSTERSAKVKQISQSASQPAQTEKVPDAPTTTSPGIPYHFNIHFGLQDRSVSFDGVLTVPGPIVNQEQYDSVKVHLAQHYGLVPEKIQWSSISSLTRLDAVQLSPIAPVQVPA